MENQNLENRIRALEKWRDDKTNQQISFPLDNRSIEILNKYYIHYLSTIDYDAGVGSNHFVTYLAQQDNLLFQLDPPSLVSYTVDVATNYLTTNQISGNIKFFDDFEVVLYTDGTPPTPLTAGGLTTYFVINSDGYTFQLSASSGGAAIDITDAGSGRQFISQ